MSVEIKYVGELPPTAGSRYNISLSHSPLTDRTRQPGDHAIESNGGSNASYLAHTPCVPLFPACFTSDKQKTNKHKHFWRDGVRDNHEPSLGQTGTRPWDKVGPVPRTNRPFSVEFHSKIAILSGLSLGRVGVRPWDDCPARAVRKLFMCFLFIVFFFSPPLIGLERSLWENSGKSSEFSEALEKSDSLPSSDALPCRKLLANAH